MPTRLAAKKIEDFRDGFFVCLVVVQQSLTKHTDLCTCPVRSPENQRMHARCKAIEDLIQRLTVQRLLRVFKECIHIFDAQRHGANLLTSLRGQWRI